MIIHFVESIFTLSRLIPAVFFLSMCNLCILLVLYFELSNGVSCISFMYTNSRPVHGRRDHDLVLDVGALRGAVGHDQPRGLTGLQHHQHLLAPRGEFVHDCNSPRKDTKDKRWLEDDLIRLQSTLDFIFLHLCLILLPLSCSHMITKRYGCAGAPETATVAAAARTASRRSGETRDDVEDVSHTGKRAGGGERSSHDEGALANAWAEAWNQPSTSPPISPPNDGNVDSGLSMAPTSSGDNGGGAAGDSGGGAAGDAEEAAAGDNGGGAARDAEEAAAERAAADTTLLSFLKPAESSSQVLGGSMATPEEDVGPEQRLLVGQCLSGLWLFGSVGAYSSW